MLSLETRTPLRQAPKAQRATQCVDFIAGLALPGFSMPFARDAEIFGEGEPADFAYKVVSGVVRTLRLLNDGRRQISGFYFAGDIFGIEPTEQHSHSAEAVTPVEIALVRQSALTKRSTESPTAARELWVASSEELRRARSHILLLGRQTALERVANFLLQMAHRQANSLTIALPMSRTDIADYLGLTIETVSRTLSQLERDGAIALANCKNVKILDRTLLERSEV